MAKKTDWGKPVFVYTIKDAEDDGVLINIIGVFKRSLISHATANLLSRGYRDKKGKLKMASMIILLNQCVHKIFDATPSKCIEELYSFEIEFPNGQSQKVFAAMNENGRFTVMLPEDY